jgi:putative tryptophan/tyrosine transport system substrate-binding protein
MRHALCALRSRSRAQPAKVHRIGYLGNLSSSACIDAFRQGLRELGYVEGKNIVIERRHHEGKLDCLPALAVELVRLSTIPIVMMQGFIPDGSVTNSV